MLTAKKSKQISHDILNLVLLHFFVTDAGPPMARKLAYRGGLVLSVSRTAFLMTTMTTDTTPVRMTEVRRAKLGGMVRTARSSVFLEMMTCEGITPVISMVTKCA